MSPFFVDDLMHRRDRKYQRFRRGTPFRRLLPRQVSGILGSPAGIRPNAHPEGKRPRPIVRAAGPRPARTRLTNRGLARNAERREGVGASQSSSIAAPAASFNLKLIQPNFILL
jgi:hypothetical protein